MLPRAARLLSKASPKPLIDACFSGGVRAARAAGDVLFPRYCLFCASQLAETASRGEPPSDFCQPCLAALAPRDSVLCRRCGAAVEGQATAADCSRCRTSRWPFDRVVALGIYEADLRQAVLRVKQPREEPLARAVSRLLFERRQELLRQIAGDVVVPVPMHWSRRWIRGGNSAETLATTLARLLSLPMASRAIVRRRRTLPQGGLPKTKRHKNVRGAFRLRRGCDFRQARVLLVDDILTTGATAAEVARLLTRAGAAAVSVAVIARALGPD